MGQLANLPTCCRLFTLQNYGDNNYTFVILSYRHQPLFIVRFFLNCKYVINLRKILKQQALINRQSILSIYLFIYFTKGLFYFVFCLFIFILYIEYSKIHILRY